MRAKISLKCDVPKDMQVRLGANMDKVKHYLEEALRQNDFANPIVLRIKHGERRRQIDTQKQCGIAKRRGEKRVPREGKLDHNQCRRSRPYAAQCLADKQSEGKNNGSKNDY